MAPRPVVRTLTAFTILWPQDGARELRVEVDEDVQEYGPLQKRLRSIATIAKTHGGLRWLLEGAFGDRYHVTVWETVGGVTTVRLTPVVRAGVT